MMKFALLPSLLTSIALLAACGTPAARRDPSVSVVAAVVTPAQPALPTNQAHDDPPKKYVNIDWAKVVIATDQDALAIWQRINPTTEDLAIKLGEIPNNAAITKPLARAMLRSGNFICPSRNIGNACSPIFELIDTPTDATLTEPCLRRELALWSIDQLDDNDAVSVAAELVAIAGLPLPETELPNAAFELLPLGPDGDALLYDMAIAAHRVHRTVPLSGENTPAVMARLLNEHHMAEPLDHLTLDEARREIIAAIGDVQLPVAARREALLAVVEANDGKLEADSRVALLRTTRDADCELAGVASRALGIGLVPSASSKPLLQLRALCLAAHAQVPLTDFIDRRGLTRVSYGDDDSNDEGGSIMTLAPDQVDNLGQLEKQAMRGTCVVKAGVVECKDSEVRAQFTFKRGRLIRLALEELPQACGTAD
jgi:hypothetical protein